MGFYLKEVVEGWQIELNGRKISAIRGKFVSGMKKLKQSQSNGMYHFIYI